MQDDELDMSPVEMDDTLMLVDGDISDEEDDHEEVFLRYSISSFYEEISCIF